MNPADFFRLGVIPPSDQSPAEWATIHVRLPYSARQPNFAITPWLREPMEAVADNEVKEICLLAPVGSGKSTMVEAAVQWSIVEDPGDTLCVMQTDEEASTWAETRLMRSMRECGPIRPLWPEDSKKVRKTQYLFPHVTIHVAGANKSSLQSKTIRWAWGDEVWIWVPGMIEELRRRRHDQWNARTVLMSQAGDEKSEWHQAYELTDKREFHWLCECGEWHPYDWNHVQYDRIEDAEGRLDAIATSESARMVCPSCQKIYADDVQIRRNLSEGGKYLATTTSKKRGHIGFHFNSMAIWWVPWRELVAEWLQADTMRRRGAFDGFRQFCQKRLAQFWNNDLEEERDELRTYGYSMSTTGPDRVDGEAHRFMTIDVQRDHFWACIRAWNFDGTSKLLFYGKVNTVEGCEELRTRYAVEPQKTWIDTGYEAGRVYDWCGKYGWVGIKGDKAESFTWHIEGQKSHQRLYSRTQRARSPSGKVVPFVLLAADRIKDILARHRNGEAAQWEVPFDVPESYKKQIDAEVKREMVAPGSGAISYKWHLRRRDNHAWDCEVYQIAAAMSCRVLAYHEI